MRNNPIGYIINHTKTKHDCLRRHDSEVNIRWTKKRAAAYKAAERQKTNHFMDRDDHEIDHRNY